MKRNRVRAAVFGLFVLAASAAVRAQDIQLDVPYVPTRFPVVEEMLRMAGVTKSDVIYDLGCGDGRILVMAAQKYGARAVGVDINPERVKEALENAKTAGVSDKVKIIEGDLFQADVKEATVLGMYLLTSVNLKLRPKILRQMLPGSRVVSHNFGMDNWKPDRQSVVRVDEVGHDVYLWIVPANISGSWIWSTVIGDKAVDFKMDVTQKFQVPEIAAVIGGAKVEVHDVKLTGDTIAFILEGKVRGKNAVLAFEGKASGHGISGAIRGRVDSQEVSLAWKAARRPGTEKDIDDEPGSWWDRPKGIA